MGIVKPACWVHHDATSIRTLDLHTCIKERNFSYISIMKIATQNSNGLDCKKNKSIELFKQNDLVIKNIIK